MTTKRYKSHKDKTKVCVDLMICASIVHQMIDKISNKGLSFSFICLIAGTKNENNRS